jgi:Carboxypeptidase regulatory-like domain
MRAARLLLMIVTLATAQDQTGNNGTGSIKGTVVDSVTHQPVREAGVSLAGDPVNQAYQVTDAAGTFEIDNLPPGQYSLDVNHREYPQGHSGSIAIKAGERAAPIILELIPFAAVSGRVLDEDSDPLPACSVHLQSARPPYQEVIAKQDFREVLGSSADGEYRLERVPAGKYILRAQCQAPVFEPRPLSAGPDPLPTSAYPPQFYPGSSTAELAEAIELRPGQERSGIDFQMKPSHMTQIHVRLSGANWRGRKDLAWQLVPAAQRAPAIALDGALHLDWLSVWHDIQTTNGEFEIPRVFPGSYRLLVTSNMRFTEGGAMIGGVLQIDVGDTPIEAEVALRPPVDLNGTIEIVGGGGGNRVTPDQVGVELVAESPNFFRRAANGAGNDAKADGSFTVRSAFPGPARIKIRAFQRCGVHCARNAVFLKSAWLGAAELPDGLLDLSSGAGGNLRIVVSTDFASIQGTAPAFAVVTASAEDSRGFSMYELNASANQNGQFKFEDLVPGKYRLGLLDQVAAGGGSSGQEVTLQEGQTLAVELEAAAGAR